MFNIHDMIRVYAIHWTIRELIIFNIALLVIFCIIRREIYRGELTLSQGISTFILIVFIGLVFSSTVFTRSSIGERRWDLNLFTSWKKALYYNNIILWRQIILNIFLLMPVGMLLPLVFGKILNLTTAWMTGACVSMGIEVSQLIFQCGVFEVDDILGNALGCMLGCVITNLVLGIIYDYRRKNVCDRFWSHAMLKDGI